MIIIMIAPNPQVTYINHHNPSSNINHHQPTLLKHKNQQEKNHELQPRPHCQVCITRITMWSKCEQTNKNPLWLPVNVTFKCVQNRKEYRQADIRWQEHMWPVFSYKCVLSSWMGMHRVRYKLPGQLKSAFSPATPPGSLRTDPDVSLTNEHLVPDFPPFIITWSLPVSEDIETEGICESNCQTNWQVTKYLWRSLRLIIDLWMIPPFLWISIARKYPRKKAGNQDEKLLSFYWRFAKSLCDQKEKSSMWTERRQV